jgi:hypothetical protein
MSHEIIEIQIQSQDVQQFDRLVAEYGEGDPSKFLSFAIRKLAKESLRTKLARLQQEARKDMGGKVFTSEETLQMIRNVQARPNN